SLLSAASARSLYSPAARYARCNFSSSLITFCCNSTSEEGQTSSSTSLFTLFSVGFSLVCSS
ncbi:hypothetical protein PENTCL1PPCAC_819, partial [Pristionchus entomophagus]